MLDAGQWDSALSTVTGQIYRGTERIATSSLLNLLQCSDDRQTRMRTGKLLVSHMRALGWTGPRTMRVTRNLTASGYWRLPCKPAGSRSGDALVEIDELEQELPAALEQVTRLALKKMARCLRLPLDEGNAGLLRSQMTAAGIAVNAQLRADEQRLRAKVTGDVLDKLLAAIERERKRSERAEDVLLSAGGGVAAREGDEKK